MNPFFKYIYFFLIGFFLNSCVTSPIIKQKEPGAFVICFWNVKNLSANGLTRETKGPFIIKFINECDSITFLEIRSVKISMAKEFESAILKEGYSYNCMEGNAKGEEEGFRKEKYLTCVKKEKFEDLRTSEYADEDNDFARPPTFFLLGFGNKKIMVVPFHSTPGDKTELTQFQKVIDYAYQNYSDRRIFFGGDFNTGTNYQKEEFLDTLPYFKVLVQLILEPTTFANQKHDLIFTDPITAGYCKSKVWKLDELFPDVDGRKNLEKISDHFPVSVECRWK